MACTELTRRGCRLELTLNIEFENSAEMNASAFAAMVTSWGQEIQAMWNGPAGHQHYGCCRVRFHVNTRVGSGTADFHQVEVVAGPQTSFVNRLGPGCTGGRWDAEDTGNVVAHESGHLLGLPDEYDYGGPGGSYRNLNPQPAGQPESIMAQTWGDVAALQSHIDGILSDLDAECPWWCCLLWPVHWLVHRLVLRTPLPWPWRRRKVSMPGIGFDELEGLSVREILDRVDSGNPGVLGAAVEALRRAGPQDPDSLLAAVEADSPLRRWVAATVLGDLPDLEPGEALSGRLEDEDLRVRVAAAHSLGRLEDRRGVPVLIEALTSNQVMLGHPPELVADHAAAVLRAITGARVSAPGDTAEARAAKWQTWWKDQQAE